MEPSVLRKTAIIEKKAKPNVNQLNQLYLTHRIRDENDYDKIITKKENLWVEYKFRPEKETMLKDKDNRERYEDFVYGYLFYYDMVLRNGSEPHSLCFRWSENYDNVGVFIYPAPKPTRSPFKKVQESIDKFNPQADFQPIKDEDNWLLPPVTSSKDPQPPPAPPPPSAES
jgi:hypothetical protein